MRPKNYFNGYLMVDSSRGNSVTVVARTAKRALELIEESKMGGRMSVGHLRDYFSRMDTPPKEFPEDADEGIYARRPWGYEKL